MTCMPRICLKPHAMHALATLLATHANPAGLATFWTKFVNPHEDSSITQIDNLKEGIACGRDSQTDSGGHDIPA